MVRPVLSEKVPLPMQPVLLALAQSALEITLLAHQQSSPLAVSTQRKAVADGDPAHCHLKSIIP
jgi:hypothetical protein